MAKTNKKGEKIPYTKGQIGAKFGLAACIIVLIALFIALLFFVLLTVNGTVTQQTLAKAQSFEKVNYENQLVPAKDADGNWTFSNVDRDFRVMQITDVHIGGGAGSVKKDSWAMNAVASMITKEKPDLVVVTGDIAFPVPYASLSFNNLNATNVFANLMESLGVYWTFTFGNHDTESYSYYTREELSDWYGKQNFKYFLFDHGAKTLNGKPVDGRGNSVIRIKNSQGLVTQALVMIDSHSYTGGDTLGILWKYDNIHQNQVDWYAAEMAKINAENKAIKADAQPVKNLAFFHIPLREYREAWEELYKANDLEGKKNLDGMTIQNGDKAKYIYGNMGESNRKNSVGQQTYGVFCGVGDCQLFEVGKQNGLQGTFCGHDHYNNFSVDYDGIRLTYGMSIDYLAYAGIWKEKSQRGCTLITITPEGTFDCERSGYYKTDANGNEVYKAQNKQ